MTIPPPFQGEEALLPGRKSTPGLTLPLGKGEMVGDHAVSWLIAWKRLCWFIQLNSLLNLLTVEHFGRDDGLTHFAIAGAGDVFRCKDIIQLGDGIRG